MSESPSSNNPKLGNAIIFWDLEDLRREATPESKQPLDKTSDCYHKYNQQRHTTSKHSGNRKYRRKLSNTKDMPHYQRRH